MLPERPPITRAAWLSGENRADKGGFVPEKGIRFLSLSSCAIALSFSPNRSSKMIRLRVCVLDEVRTVWLAEMRVASFLLLYTSVSDDPGGPSE
jgi:hypothetical protein